ncbi:hypothetical protein AA309_30615 [Microvirga vignae]|uniref:Uncharacterized protein n=1 Tax=Microvirga vignae TaxID=1225564 RepID=A0A0H1R383_9HYPH|nr:hypothetical protein [Microvirga vignae]KLK89578.1 hypothetical protein AA309_30615 [Microvirga vignae]
MVNENKKPIDEAVEDTIERATQAIKQTRTEIARSQALSQAEAELAQSIERMVEEHADPADER